MSKTFPDRRALILDPPLKTLSIIKNEYPLLFSYRQIREEFNRLTDQDLTANFATGVAKYIKLASLKPYKNEHDLIKELRKRVNNSQSESRREFCNQCCAVAVVPQQLREGVADFFYQESVANSYPQIQIVSMEDTISVYLIVVGGGRQYVSAATC